MLAFPTAHFSAEFQYSVLQDLHVVAKLVHIRLLSGADRGVEYGIELGVYFFGGRSLV